MITKAELKRRWICAEAALKALETRLYMADHKGLTGAECHQLSLYAHEVLANNRKGEE